MSNNYKESKNNTLKNVISQLMSNDKNGNWFEVKTIEHLKECLLCTIEQCESIGDDVSCIFYMNLLKILEDLEY